MLIITTFSSRSGDAQGWLHPQRAQATDGTSGSARSDRLGLLAAFDLDNGELVYSMALDSPTGFSIDGNQLFVNSMYGNNITSIDDRLQVVDRFGLPLMNDLHSSVVSKTGLLITSSGTDAILEVTPSGHLSWSWLATENGYRRTPRGISVPVRRNHDYRSRMIDTLDQATHCNSAINADYRGRDVVLSTLFHQGEIIAIDRATGKHEALFRGMNHPHSIQPCGGGWVVCDSFSSAVVLLDRNFWVTQVIEEDFRWVQDAIALDEGKRLLIADANNSRLVVWDVAAGKAEHVVTYSSGWKVYQVKVADQRWESCFRAAGRASP